MGLKLIENTMRGAIAIPLQDVPLLDSRIKQISAIPTGLQEGKKMYEGLCIGQNGENTCAVVSLENAVLAAGGKISQLLHDDLYAEATIINDAGEQQGLTFDVLEDIVSAYPELGIVLSGLEAEDMLLPVFSKELSNPDYTTIMALRNNAVTIKSVTDSGDAIISTICEPGEEEYHAVAVVGYRVDRYGHMTVQYIDGVLGFIEMPLEYFSTVLATNYDVLSMQHIGDTASVKVHIDTNTLEKSLVSVD